MDAPATGGDAERTAAYEAAGLYDPTAPGADDRLALLEWLRERGLTLEELVAAHAQHELVGAAGDRKLRPGGRVTVDEMAARAGVPRLRIEKVLLAAGLPVNDPRDLRYTERDVELLRIFDDADALFGEEAVLQFTRVMGSALARIADAANTLFLVNVEKPLVEEARGELALAIANLEAVTLLETVPGIMDTLFRAHMEEAVLRSRVARSPGGSLETAMLAVGFVDLVGFTPLAQRLDIAELGAVVDDFEARASDLVAAQGGRVVKLIGDEVMFVTVRVAAACRVATTLVEQFERDAGITPRGAISAGEVLTRGGDVYGPVVNVAARVAQLAVPGEVLVTEPVREGAGGENDDLRFEPAGRRMLKGFDEPVTLYSVTRSRPTA